MAQQTLQDELALAAAFKELSGMRGYRGAVIIVARTESALVRSSLAGFLAQKLIQEVAQSTDRGPNKIVLSGR